jgi:Immunoglobulin domain
VLYFQWRLNGTNLLNATNLTLLLPNVTPPQAGNYTLFVSNYLGPATSASAGLRVLTNDFCSGATVLTGNSVTVSEPTTTATTASDPVPNCVAGLFGKGVWFVFTPPGTGTVVVDTLGSSFDTVLGIYTGSCGALTQIGCDDDSGGGVSSRITFAVNNGIPHSILAGGWNGASGNVLLNLNFTQSTPPVISPQPVGQTVPVGGTATFNVTASGTAPFSYFWRRNGSFITGGNAAAYVTNNVRLADSGAQFSCLVSNAVGTAISSNAVLVVDPALVIAITNVALNPARQLQFRVTGQPGDVYRVQTATNLPGTWQTLTSLTNVTGNTLFTDLTSTNVGNRFYRCVLP